MKVCGSCGTRDPDDPYPREVTAAHMVTMNFRVYELGSMNFSVVAHSPRPPPGKQLNVPQPGFFIWYLLRFQRVKVKISGNNNRTNKIYRNRSSNTN